MIHFGVLIVWGERWGQREGGGGAEAEQLQ